MSDSSLSKNPASTPFERSGKERRQREMGPPEGEERRLSDSDRRMENNRHFVSFFVAGQLLGIPVHEVQEVLPVQELTRVPLATSCVAGLLNLRGQIVSVVDLRTRMGLAPQEGENNRMHIIVANQGELFSLLADSVGDVMTIAKSRFQDAPPTLDNAWRKFCSGVYRLNQGLLVAVDISALLSLAEENAPPLMAAESKPR